MAGQGELIDLVRKVVRQQKELGIGDFYVSKEKTSIPGHLDPKLRKAEKARALNALYEEIKDCTRCGLCQGRNKLVFGVGNPGAEIMFVGEGPGRDEDLKGEPFVGRAGQLLDKILAAINFDRTQVYIGNVVKCRPPDNRDPSPVEMATCLPHLEKQIEIIDPVLVCCLGRIAAHALLNTSSTLGKLRGTFHDYRGRKLMVTYHPAALLRYPQYKRSTWEDVQLLRREHDMMLEK